MDWDQYQKWVVSKQRKGLAPKWLMANMALGMAGEAGEAADVVKKHVFHGKALDRDNLTKELGDVAYYLAGLADVAGIRLSDVIQANIYKLDVRYPNGFDASRAHATGEVPTEERPATKYDGDWQLADVIQKYDGDWDVQEGNSRRGKDWFWRISGGSVEVIPYGLEMAYRHVYRPVNPDYKDATRRIDEGYWTRISRPEYRPKSNVPAAA